MAAEPSKHCSRKMMSLSASSLKRCRTSRVSRARSGTDDDGVVARGGVIARAHSGSGSPEGVDDEKTKDMEAGAKKLCIAVNGKL